MMQDGKALQAGTSHFLGQNFAKAFDVKFSTDKGELEYVWGTSWGASTRLMGALIMAHSDDNGLVLPPKLAPTQVVIVPIHKGDEQLEEIRKVALNVGAQLKAKGITWKFDDRTTFKPGWKFAEYELKGYPVRIAIGPKDLENGTVELARRDTLTKATYQFSDTLGTEIEALLEEMQINIYEKALKFREENTHIVDSYEEFKTALDEKGGFYYAHWDGTAETEEKIKNETKATIRCIPIEDDIEAGVCMVTGKPSTRRVVFARAY
jgi:prolyl-tRNA synthetase